MSDKKKKVNVKTKKTSQYLLTGVIGAALAVAMILSVGAIVVEEADAARSRGDCTRTSTSTCCMTDDGMYCTTLPLPTPPSPK